MPNANLPLSIRSLPGQVLSFRNDGEYHYLEVFRENLVPQLTGSFATPLWDHIVLQMCNEPSVRGAVIAFAALCMSTTVTHQDPTGYPCHYKHALQQYDTAIMDMREAVANRTSGIGELLIGCLLVFCFESYQGNHDVAISQAKSGYKLLQESQTDARIGNSSFENELIHTFSRLDLHVMTVLDVDGFEAHQIG